MPFISHISIRVPWHDDQWRGTVCKKPGANLSCIVLSEIAAKKVNEAEECVAGRRFDELAELVGLAIINDLANQSGIDADHLGYY